jgi:hypothetical protein
MQRIAGVDRRNCNFIKHLLSYGATKVLMRGGAATFLCKCNLTSAVNSIATACPWPRTRADEAKRGKGPDSSAMGQLDFDASCRSGWTYRQGFAAVLLRIAGRWIAAAGFPIEGPGQMADHSRLAVGRPAVVRSLDDAGATDAFARKLRPAGGKSGANKC